MVALFRHIEIFAGFSLIKESQHPLGEYIKKESEFLLESNFKRGHPEAY